MARPSMLLPTMVSYWDWQPLKGIPTQYQTEVTWKLHIRIYAICNLQMVFFSICNLQMIFFHL